MNKVAITAAAFALSSCGTDPYGNNFGNLFGAQKCFKCECSIVGDPFAQAVGEPKVCDAADNKDWDEAAAREVAEQECADETNRRQDELIAVCEAE